MPIRPLLPQLTFITDPQRWGYVFRFGLLSIPEADFIRITRADAPPKPKPENPHANPHYPPWRNAALPNGGAADAPVLVLHGGLGSADDFAASAGPRLQTHYRLISRRTRAATGAPPSATYHSPTRKLPTTPRNCCITSASPNTACSVSAMEGTAAYRLRARQPRRRKAHHRSGASWQPESLKDMRELYAAINPAFLRENMGAQVAAYEAVNPEANLDRLAEALKALWLDDGDSGYPGASIGKIRAPVLAIRGEGDFFAMHELLALHAAAAQRTLMNVPAEHEAIADQPDLYLGRVAGVPRSVRSASRRPRPV